MVTLSVNFGQNKEGKPAKQEGGGRREVTVVDKLFEV